MKINSEQEMLQFGEEFAKSITQTPTGDGAGGTPTGAPATVGETATAGPVGPTIIELIGDVGAGKTTFTRGLAKGLGIKEEITSPSFTISKVYSLPNGKTLTHYDFYRLQDPGLMKEDLEESISNPNNYTIIEWGESVSDILPKNHTTINIKYNDDGSREVIL